MFDVFDEEDFEKLLDPAFDYARKALEKAEESNVAAEVK